MDYLDLHLFVRQTVEDKALGVMIGSALGDSIGLYTGSNPFSGLEKYHYSHGMQNFYLSKCPRKPTQKGSFPW